MAGRDLIRETEWMRVYQSGPNELRYESKFLTEGLEVSAASVRSRWEQMSYENKLEFVQAFGAKPNWSPEDVRVVDFLIEVGSPEIRSAVALLLPKGRDKLGALHSLLDCVAHESTLKANYYQALAYLQERSALSALMGDFRSYRERLDEGVAKPSTADRQSLIDYLSCARAILSLGGPPECKRPIEELQRHPSPEIREFATLMLRRPEQPWPW